MKRTGLLLFIIWVGSFSAAAQDQPLADSLKSMLAQTDLDDEMRILVLDDLIVSLSNPDSVIWYAKLLLEQEGLPDSYAMQAYQSLGVGYRKTGDLGKSLDALFTSAELALATDTKGFLAEAYIEIGATYSSNDDITNALRYNYKAIALFKQLRKPRAQSINLLNVGYFHYIQATYDSALYYYGIAEPIFDSLNFTIGRAYLYGNRALVYAKTGELVIAEQDLLRAIDMLEPIGDRYGMADYHNQLGNVYRGQGKIQQAIFHLEKGLGLAKPLDLKEQIRDASLALSEILAQQGAFDRALAYHQQYVTIKDSIANNEQTQRMADFRTEFEVNLRESEIANLEKEKQLQQIYVITAIILFVLAVVVLLYFRQRFRTARFVAATQQKEYDAEINTLLKTQETEALQAMVQGKEDERKKLAKELHNHLGVLLATAKVNLHGLESPDTTKHQTVVNLVEQACQDVRNLSHEMNMGISENFGLASAVKELVAHLQKSKEIQIAFSASLDTVMVDAKSEIVIYRIVQELISNVLKHAKASKLSISLTGYEEENLVNIMVEDNGVGFDPQALDPGNTGIGLDSLHDMVSTMEGEMSIDSRPGVGTTINIDFPFSPPETITEHD
ncbi:MAG TPA: hypothetical protein DCE41_05970 [Cytophagales bacterium]|nr:hypothetical protein [Cytophagales bacterium]HAA21985.1 hypothetical protein [Cytophagales bacterium]HAP63792.1 hypothetical protein [Cytophagales bacterium]